MRYLLLALAVFYSSFFTLFFVLFLSKLQETSVSNFEKANE